MDNNLSVFIAFGAGLMSFLSPCVLPLIPSWLCIIGGSPMTGESEKRPKPVIGTVSFVLGFSLVFIIFSVIFSATFNLMGGFFRYINIIAGVIVIILGLNIIFNFIGFLNYEKKYHFKNTPRGIFGAFIAGCAFGAGWTPCVGPILTGIFMLAAQSGGIPRAVLYLAVYSAGLGLPFIIAAFSFDFFLKLSAKLRKYMPIIQRISGILLVIIGIFIITGQNFSLKTPAAFTQTGSEISGVVSDALRKAGIQVLPEAVLPSDFTLQKPDGTLMTLSEQKGKVVFLNFWATWCPPCRNEMPSMEALYGEYKEKGMEILAVNIGEPRGEVSQFINEYGLSFSVLLDSSETISDLYNIRAIPASYIINKQGFIVGRLTGAIDWNSVNIKAVFDALLEEFPD